MLWPALLECRLLVRTGVGLVARLPLCVGHAVDQLARLVLGDCEATRLCRFAVPVRQAISAESCEIHEVDVLDVAPAAEVLDQPAEGGGLEFGSGWLVDLAHGNRPGSVVWFR